MGLHDIGPRSRYVVLDLEIQLCGQLLPHGDPLMGQTAAGLITVGSGDTSFLVNALFDEGLEYDFVPPLGDQAALDSAQEGDIVGVWRGTLCLADDAAALGFAEVAGFISGGAERVRSVGIFGVSSIL